MANNALLAEWERTMDAAAAAPMHLKVSALQKADKAARTYLRDLERRVSELEERCKTQATA